MGPIGDEFLVEDASGELCAGFAGAFGFASDRVGEGWVGNDDGDVVAGRGLRLVWYHWGSFLQTTALMISRASRTALS